MIDAHPVVGKGIRCPDDEELRRRGARARPRGRRPATRASATSRSPSSRCGLRSTGCPRGGPRSGSCSGRSPGLGSSRSAGGSSATPSARPSTPARSATSAGLSDLESRRLRDRRGGRWSSPFIDPAAGRAAVTTLTPRQREVLQLFADGLSTGQAAKRLGPQRGDRADPRQGEPREDERPRPHPCGGKGAALVADRVAALAGPRSASPARGPGPRVLSGGSPCPRRSAWFTWSAGARAPTHRPPAGGSLTRAIAGEGAWLR